MFNRRLHLRSIEAITAAAMGRFARDGFVTPLRVIAEEKVRLSPANAASAGVPRRTAATTQIYGGALGPVLA